MKTKLTAALKVNIADRTLLVRVALEGGKAGVLKSLQAQMPKTPLSVLVKPVLAEGSVAALQRQIGIVPVEVVLAGGQKAKQTAAEIAAVSTSAGGATVAGDTAAQATLAAQRAAARKAAAEAAAAIAGNPDAERLILEATQALVGATADLEAATAALTKANTALTESEVELNAATVEGNAGRKGRAAANNELAASTQRQAQLDFDAAAAAKAEADTQIAAADAQAAASERVVKVQTAVAAAKEKVLAAGVSNVNVLELETTATNAASLAQSEFTKLQNAGQVAAAEQVAALKVEALQLKELIAAQLGLTEVAGLTAGISGAGRAGGTDLAKEQLRLAAAKRADAEATKVLEVAQRSGDAETIRAADAASQATRKIVQETEAKLADLRVDEARGPAQARIAAINSLVTKANDPTLSLASRATAATQAQALATKSVEEFAVAEKGASIADKERLATLAGTTAGLKEQTVAQNQASIAAEKAAATLRASAASSTQFRAQAERGAAATGATFLGLRGAVLSASTGFLLATVAVTGLAKIVATAEELQHSLNVFRSVSGATNDQLIQVDATARTLGADLTLPATSATDAAHAMTTLAKAGLSVEQSMAAAKGVLQLAAAAQIDVGDAADIVATELNSFGLAGDQATRVVDLLAGASIAAQGDISDFSLAFQQSSAVAHQVGLSIEQTTAILTQFAKAGLHGSDAGTSLRTLLLRLVPTTKAAADAQAELGININRNIPIGQQFSSLVDQYSKALARLGPVAQQETLTKIFGQDAIRGASLTLTQGAAALEQVQATVSKSGQAAEITKGQTDGLGGSVEGLKSEVQTLSATIGSQFLPVLDATAHTIAAIASNANSAVTELNKLSSLTIKPIANIFGGVNTFVPVAVAAAAGATLRSLNSGRAAKALNEQVEKTVVSVNQALEKESITQDEANALWKVIGISAEDAGAIQLRITQEATGAFDKQVVSMKSVAEAQNELAAAAAKNPSARLSGLAAASAARGAAGVPGAVLAPSVTQQTKAAIAASRAEATAAQKTVLAEEEKAAAINQATIAYERQGAAAVTAGAGEVAAAEKAALAQRIASRAGGLVSGNKGLATGIGLSVAGGIIGGRAGGLLTAAGTGAALGSFLPGPGTAIGAAAFTGFELFKQAKDADNKARADFKSHFNSLTFSQQQMFLRINGLPVSGVSTSSFVRDALKGIVIKKDSLLASFRQDLGDNAAAAESAAADQAQKDAEKVVADLIFAGGTVDQISAAREDLANKIKAANEADSKNAVASTNFFNRGGNLTKGAAAQFADFTRQAKPILLPRQSILLPQQTAPLGVGQSIVEANGVARLKDINQITGKQELNDKATIQAIKDFIAKNKGNALQIQLATAALQKERERQAFNFGALVPQKQDPVVAAILTGAQRLGQVNAAQQNALKVLQAQLDGNDQLVTRFLNQAIGIAHRASVRLQAALEAAKETGNGPAIQKAAAALAQGRQAELSAIQAANQNLATQATNFDAAGAAQTEIAASDAQRTKTRADDLATAHEKTVRDQKRLTFIANQQFRLAKDRRAALDAQRLVISQDSNAEQTIRDQIASDNKTAADNAKKAADQAIQNQNDLLQRAADAAGNVGAAENKYIAFLKQRVNAAKQTTAERIAAENAYNAELKKRQDALQGILDARLNLRQASLDNALARAQATTTTSDDIKVFKGYIKLDRERIAIYQSIVQSKTATRLQVLDAQLKIKNLQGDIFSQQQAIKGVTAGGSGGFTLGDLFKAGVDQFATFGSNIAARNGVLSPQDARASLGETIAIAAGKQLTAQQRTNALLASIDRNTKPKAGGGVQGGGSAGFGREWLASSIASSNGWGI